MNDIQIGWIGLGNMGIPMAEQLIQAAYPLTVFNRNQAKTQKLTDLGAGYAETPEALIQKTDVVFVMVSDDQAIREIFSGENGLLSAETSGKIIVNMSTVSPSISKEMAALCEAQGSHYLDAPVSGSVKQAETGQLVIMVGGEERVFEQVKPILEKLGKLALRVGDTGSGNGVKLAINSLLALYAHGLAETVLFANQQGIQTEDLLTLLSNGALGNIFTKIKGDLVLQENFAPVFALKHMVKDLSLAQSEGLKGPLAEAALRSFQQAQAKYGEEDVIAIIKALDEK